MNEPFVMRGMIDGAPQYAAGRETVWPVTIITDAEMLSRQSLGAAQLASAVQRLCQTETAPILVESALPEVRMLAVLLAATRTALATAPSPDHFTDAADWLAARIVLLKLSHVALHPAELPLLDQANERLQRFAVRTVCHAPAALPVLLSGASFDDANALMRCAWRRAPLYEACAAKRDVLAAVNASLGIKDNVRLISRLWTKRYTHSEKEVNAPVRDSGDRSGYIAA